MEEDTEAGPSQPSAEQKQQIDPAGRMPMAIDQDRISWGDGSAPSLPSVDDDSHSVGCKKAVGEKCID